MWYVYFLQLANGDIYAGSTNDLKRRAASHGRGQAESTRSSLPVRLRAYVAVETEAVARRLERYFKSGSGKAVAKKTIPSIGLTATRGSAIGRPSRDYEQPVRTFILSGAPHSPSWISQPVRAAIT